MGKKYTLDGKPRKSGIGKLFLGIFLGFIMCIGSLFGIGWFAYNNLSAQWLNDTFKTNVDLGSEDMNKKTIKDFVSSAISLSQKIDTYSLNDLKKDFGVFIDDKLMGIDITDLKNVPVKELVDAAQDKFSNISADELKDVVDLTDMDLILNKTNTYYLSGTTLYEEDKQTAVDKDVIDYTLESRTDGTYVVFKDQARKVESDNSVEFELRFLPLTKALGDFMGTMGDKITVGELVDPVDGFGVELPSYLHDTEAKKARTINELESLVNELYLADFLGYTISGTKVMNGTTEVTGIVAKLAKKTVEELKDVETIINTSTVAEIFDYTYKNGTYYYMDGETEKEVTGIMKALATTQVQNLTKEVAEMSVLKALGYTTYTKDDGSTGYKDESGAVVTGALTILDLQNTKITEIATELQTAIESKTLSELADAGVIDASASELEAVSLDEYDSYMGRTLGDLKVNEAIDLLLTILTATN